MAGDWIKIRTDLHEDPAVICISTELSKTENEVVGMLVKFWSWLDRQSYKCYIENITSVWIDKYVCCQGFANLLIKVGWLEVLEDGISIPNYDRHMSTSAKKRATAQKYMKSVRNKNKQMLEKRTTKEQPEKRREEKSINLSPKGDVEFKKSDLNLKNKEPGNGNKNRLNYAEFFSAWNQLPEPIPHVQRMSDKRKKKLRTRMADSWWCDNWRKALDKIPQTPFLCGDNNRGWKADIDFFLQPDSVTKILEGKYDKANSQDEYGFNREVGELWK